MEPGDIIETTEPGLGVCTVDYYHERDSLAGFPNLSTYTRQLLQTLGSQVGFAVTDYEFGEDPGYQDTDGRPILAVRARFSLVKVGTPEGVRTSGDNH